MIHMLKLKMDLVHHFAPEIGRSLSTIFIILAASRDSGSLHCAPSLHCAAGDPTEDTPTGYPFSKILTSFTVGVCVGGAVVLWTLSYFRRRPSAAAIALGRNK
jgi:hypothetical protein